MMSCCGCFPGALSGDGESNDYVVIAFDQQQVKLVYTICDQKHASWAPDSSEICKLRQSWPQDSRQLQSIGRDTYIILMGEGSDIFTGIFPHYGDIRASRPSPHFHRQCMVMVKVITQSLKRMDRPSELHEYLFGLGGYHCRFSDRGIRPKHWLLFREAINQVVQRRVVAAQAEDEDGSFGHLWHSFISFMVKCMFEGYQAAIAVQP